MGGGREAGTYQVNLAGPFHGRNLMKRSPRSLLGDMASGLASPLMISGLETSRADRGRVGFVVVGAPAKERRFTRKGFRVVSEVVLIALAVELNRQRLGCRRGRVHVVPQLSDSIDGRGGG